MGLLRGLLRAGTSPKLRFLLWFLGHFHAEPVLGLHAIREGLMPQSAKLFCGFFLFLAAGFFGLDVYTWQNSGGRPFSFADLGYLSKTHFPEEHQLVVDALTPETFNAILTPVLQIPAVFLFAGLAAVALAIGLVSTFLGKRLPGQKGPKKPSAFKYNRR